jgi:hypothetical protein
MPRVQEHGHPVRGQKLALGRARAHTVHVAEQPMDRRRLRRTRRAVRRTTTEPVRSWRAQRPRTTTTAQQPAAGA